MPSRESSNILTAVISSQRCGALVALRVLLCLIDGGASSAQSLPASAGGRASSISVHTSGFDAEGIHILCAGDQTFDATIRRIFTSWAPTLMELKPILVVVSNQSPKIVLGYSVVFDMRTRSGERIVQRVHFKYPDGVTGSGYHSLWPSVPCWVLKCRNLGKHSSLHCGAPRIVARGDRSEYGNDQ